jgi:hypothetical protein
MAIAYHVRRVAQEHRDTLPPVVLNIVGGGDSPGSFSFTDYLTVEQAFKIAADLTAQAMKVEREDGVEQDVPF